MKKALAATQKNFESSSSKTPEYLAWHRLFKKEFKQWLTNFGAICIEIGKPNHFDISGFFEMGTTCGCSRWYFRIGDIRWSKDTMLIRTVKDYKDYTGGRNQYVSLKQGEACFVSELATIITCK